MKSPAYSSPVHASATARSHPASARGLDDVSVESYLLGMTMNEASPPAQGPSGSPGRADVCPWWAGPLLCCPLRRLWESPEELLGPHVHPGMAVLEPGCGMGYFSLPLARMAGPSGRVVCVDLQPKMVAGLVRRARRAGLAERIDASVCSAEDLGVGQWRARVDLAVAIHMVHEVPDPGRLFTQVHEALRPGGRFLILEPKGHVSPEAFDDEVALAARAGFVALDRPLAKRSHAALLSKPQEIRA
jgi:SAM-dependent methyltransferase